MLASCDVGAHNFNLRGEPLDFGAGLRKGGFLRLRALEARIFVIFQAVGLGAAELNLVLDSQGLLGRVDGIELLPEAGNLLAMGSDLSFEPSAQRVLSTERRRNLGRLAFGSGKRGLGPSNLLRQCAHLPIQAGAVEFDGLELNEVFNQCLHQ